nr:importin-5-like [Ipomoea batatas]
MKNGKKQTRGKEEAGRGERVGRTATCQRSVRGTPGERRAAPVKASTPAKRRGRINAGAEKKEQTQKQTTRRDGQRLEKHEKQREAGRKRERAGPGAMEKEGERAKGPRTRARGDKEDTAGAAQRKWRQGGTQPVHGSRNEGRARAKKGQEAKRQGGRRRANAPGGTRGPNGGDCSSLLMASPSSSHSQIKTLLHGDDSNPFFHFLNNLFSEDEAVRRPADSLFNAAMKEFPNALSNKLAFAINTNPNPQIRIRCSTLFSRFLDNNWLLLVHPMFHKKFKTFFIQLLRDEQEWEALKIHCNCVSKMAALLFPKPGWPELLVSMFLWLCSPDSTPTNPASVILLNILIPKYPQFFYDYADILNLVFQRLMDQVSGDTRLRSATVGAAVKLIVYLAIPNDYYEYYGLLTGMISVLGDVVFCDQDLACSVLDEMVVLARGKPWFLAVHIKSMAEAMLKIVSDTGLEEKTRKAAVEFLVTVAEGGDEGYEMIRNLPSNLIEELLAQLLRMLMCVKDGISWMVEVNADDMEAAGKMSYAEEALSWLAIALGGDVILPNSPDMLLGFFKDDDWKKHCAAVTSLGLIASGCSKVILALSDAMDDFGNPIVQVVIVMSLS